MDKRVKIFFNERIVHNRIIITANVTDEIFTIDTIDNGFCVTSNTGIDTAANGLVLFSIEQAIKYIKNNIKNNL